MIFIVVANTFILKAKIDDILYGRSETFFFCFDYQNNEEMDGYILAELHVHLMVK